MFFAGVIAGDRPPRYGENNVLLTVGEGLSFARPSGTRALITSVGQDRLILPIRERVLPSYSLLKVRRTLMSIARAGRQVRKVL